MSSFYWGIHYREGKYTPIKVSGVRNPMSKYYGFSSEDKAIKQCDILNSENLIRNDLYDTPTN